MRTLLLLMLAVATGLLAGHSGPAYADLGVGISHAAIAIEETLSQGGRYSVPSVTVTNTGTEPSRYEVTVTSIQDQRELIPDPNWFHFDPQSFDLEPGQSRTVTIALHVGDGAEPGDYFALIEAHPIQAESGVTVGVAAATKLTFEVEPSSFLELWRLRIAHFFEDTGPYSIVIPPIIAGLILLTILSRRFRLRIERRS
jgi:hypothetical protein